MATEEGLRMEDAGLEESGTAPVGSGRRCCGLLPMRRSSAGAYGAPDAESALDEEGATETNLKGIEKRPKRALAILDHSCAYVCVLGMCLMIVAAIALLPVALMFTVNEEVDNVFISEGESLIKDQGVAYIEEVLLDLDIPDVSGSRGTCGPLLSHTLSTLHTLRMLCTGVHQTREIT